MDETIKKRGRKKKDICAPVTESAPPEEPVRKKRGRKKKWETTTFKNNYIQDKDYDELVYDNEAIQDDYSTNALSFGNLCIQVHDKEKEENVNITDFFKEDPKDCDILLSSDEEDTCDYVKENIKTIKHYYNGINVTKNMQNINEIRCYNCHHSFSCIPFYLPINYCPTLHRYKLFGNFCSPNCVKSFCLNNKIFANKSYLVGQFYRALFGQGFKIKCAPSIFTLKEYGGDKTIEEFRQLFYINSRYTMNNVNTKIIAID